MHTIMFILFTLVTSCGLRMEHSGIEHSGKVEYEITINEAKLLKYFVADCEKTSPQATAEENQKCADAKLGHFLDVISELTSTRNP